MPRDPKHKRNIPAGQSLYRVLARLLHRYGTRCLVAVAAGRVPPPFPRQMLVAAVLPHLARHYAHAYRAGLREVRRKRSGKGKRKALGSFLPGVGLRQAMAAVLNPFAVTRPESPPAGAGAPGFHVGFDVFDEKVQVAAEKLALELAGEVEETTKNMVRQQLAEGLAAGESNRQLAKRLLPAFDRKRAMRIARTEASRSHSQGQMASWKDAGVDQVEWLASSAACGNCRFLEGSIVRIGEPFIVLSHGRPAYRVVYHPPLHPCCACAVSPVVT
jgi:SPP1 gp7 family putative phage head morphogenesis protein